MSPDVTELTGKGWKVAGCMPIPPKLTVAGAYEVVGIAVTIVGTAAPLDEISLVGCCGEMQVGAAVIVRSDMPARESGAAST